MATLAMWLLPQLVYVKRVEVIRGISRVLFSEERGPSTEPGQPGRPLALLAVEALGQLVDGFPGPDKYANEENIAPARKWMEEHPDARVKN
jgi:hypothetical protein